MKIRCLLFDLDGTLVDSRDDLADAVNLTLSEMKLATLPVAAVYDFIGEGVFNLLDRSLSASAKTAASEQLTNRGVEIFRRHYEANCLVKTRLYDGVAAALAGMDGWQKAVVTNKPRDFSVKILEAFGIASHFALVAGGDSFPERKPSPLPLLRTAEKLACAPGECLMIGDSRVDVEAGKNAGMRTVGLTGGFRGRAELERAGADYLVADFAELARLLRLVDHPGRAEAS
jgi:phosphoglycolate phosphatase